VERCKFLACSCPADERAPGGQEVVDAPTAGEWQVLQLLQVGRITNCSSLLTLGVWGLLVKSPWPQRPPCPACAERLKAPA